MRPMILAAAAIAALAIAGCSGTPKQKGDPGASAVASAPPAAARAVTVPIAASEPGPDMAGKVAKLRADATQGEQDIVALTRGSEGAAPR